MLAADGYKVLHSTRHCLLEFGKDILAIAPDGVGCAFQLKGNPKGRMTAGQFRQEIQPQLVQLMAQAPAYPGFPVGIHRAYLVSNGQFEEEVQVATRDMNALPFPSKVELWSRGHLYDLSMKHAKVLWPSELASNRSLLGLYLANPRDQLPVNTLAGLLEAVLHLEPDSDPLKGPALSRAASSAAWVTGISTASFAEAENHHAVASAWALCCVALIGASERHAAGDETPIHSSFVLARSALIDALSALWNEVKSRKYLVEGDPFADAEIHGWRVGVLFGLLSSLALADAESSVLDTVSRQKLSEWLASSSHRATLWGEGAIANLFPFVVWFRKNVATTRPDDEIFSLASAVLNGNQSRSKLAIPNPYYSFEAAYRLKSPFGVVSERGTLRETFEGSSHMAEVLFHLLARTVNKGRCKTLWEPFSRLSHRRLVLEESWHYCLLNSRKGIEETKIYPLQYDWTQLRRDSTQGNCAGADIPRALRVSPWLLSMWWQVAAHRLDTCSARHFVNSLLPGWGEVVADGH